MAVTLYRQVGKGKDRRYRKVNVGRGRRRSDLTGPYFLRYSLADGTRPWEHVGDDVDEAIARVNASRPTSMLSTQTYPSFKTRTMLSERKSRTLCISGSPSFSFSRAKTSKERARRRCGLTITGLGSFLTSLCRTICVT
jgi:hypothetical protein